MLRILGIAIALCLIVPSMSFAHGGRTDSSGCHTNKVTGNYHCHNKGTVPEAWHSVIPPRMQKTVIPKTFFTCKVTSLNYTYVDETFRLSLEGATTCKEGKISLRLYDDEGHIREFISKDDAYIVDGVFSSLIVGVGKHPGNLVVEYSISRE